MMRLFANSFRANAAYKNGIVVIGACAVIAICVTGLAALTGMLPESESVARARAQAFRPPAARAA